MSLKEIAFLANWAKGNPQVVKLIATNTKWLENGIVEILTDLELKANSKTNHDEVISKPVPYINRNKR